MKFMLSESYNQTGFGMSSFLKKVNSTDLLVEVGPRVSIVTAWCTNAVCPVLSLYYSCQFSVQVTSRTYAESR